MDKSMEVIVSDMHHRVSGVSATIRTLVPIMNEHLKLTLVSPHAEPNVETVGVREIFRRLSLLRDSGTHVIWHARRNNEMAWAIFARKFINPGLKIVFTSAAKRRHSAYPRWLIRQMDAIIATSEEAAGFVAPVVATIPHGVDCNRFRPMDRDELHRDHFGLSGIPLMGIFGRVRPEKGTDLFVQAAINLLPKHPTYKALIVGKATRKFKSFKADLEATIKEAGLEDRFIWLDGVPFNDMNEVYQSVKLCVAPARYEGFGLVPLEAMACETAVVASRTGAYEDIVASGVTGELVDCDDLDGLELAMNSVLSDPAKLEKMAVAGRQRVLSQFSADIEASKIIAVYQQVDFS